MILPFLGSIKNRRALIGSSEYGDQIFGVKFSSKVKVKMSIPQKKGKGHDFLTNQKTLIKL